MNVALAGLALADSVGLVGSSGVHVTWADLDTEPGGTTATFRTLFGSMHKNFRRFDKAARLLAMACEAAGVAELIPGSARQDTPLLVETELGCLQTDRAFAASMSEEMADSSAFPYTLANTSLGELAIRYGLRGSTYCLSVDQGQDGLAFAEALRLLEDGDASHAVVGRVEWLESALGSWQPQAQAVVAVLAAVPGPGGSISPAAMGAPWPETGQPVFSRLAEHVARTARRA